MLILDRCLRRRTYICWTNSICNRLFLKTNYLATVLMLHQLRRCIPLSMHCGIIFRCLFGIDFYINLCIDFDRCCPTNGSPNPPFGTTFSLTISIWVTRRSLEAPTSRFLTRSATQNGPKTARDQMFIDFRSIFDRVHLCMKFITPTKWFTTFGRTALSIKRQLFPQAPPDARVHLPPPEGRSVQDMSFRFRNFRSQ